jgi:hypothetical protein
MALAVRRRGTLPYPMDCSSRRLSLSFAQTFAATPRLRIVDGPGESLRPRAALLGPHAAM